MVHHLSPLMTLRHLCIIFTQISHIVTACLCPRLHIYWLVEPVTQTFSLCHWITLFLWPKDICTFTDTRFWLDMDWHISSLRFCFSWILPPSSLVMTREEPLGSTMGNRNWYNKGNSDLLPPLHCWTLAKQLHSNPSKLGSFFWEMALGWMLPKTFYIELGGGGRLRIVFCPLILVKEALFHHQCLISYIMNIPHPLSTFKGHAKGWLLVQGSSAFQQSQSQNDSNGSCSWCPSPYWCHLRKKK